MENGISKMAGDKKIKPPNLQKPPKPGKTRTESGVRFPIRVKLIIIVTALLMLSLGLITALVAFFVSRDIERTAWTNNDSINEMSSIAANEELRGVVSKVSVLLNDRAVLYSMTDGELGSEFYGFFFRENPEIAAIALMPLGKPDERLILRNEQFFREKEIQPSMADAFLAVERRAFDSAAGGADVILNAAPAFGGLPILVLFWNWQGGGENAVCAAFFSSESITTSFGTGSNSSMLINNSGDVLVAADQSLLGAGTNLANMPFVEDALAITGDIYKTRYKDRQGRDYFGTAKRVDFANALTITTIPADVVFEGISTTTWRNIYLSVGVWFLSILFIWFFAKSISGPLRSLTSATRAIEDGEYHISLRSKRQDETGVLTRSVVSMSHVLENFESFTNKEIARLARQGKLDTSGATKNITMFFSDIRAFTAISEKITPNEVISFLNEYMERMVACVLITGGAIDKFIGDAVMAYWGAVTSAGSAEIDALSGVKAALMMRASLKCFNKGRGGDRKPVIKIGCGLNSGSVVAGQIGSAERIVFTVIGDAVSLADRTETLNKPFGTEILITEHTQKLVDNQVITEKMGEITEKGEKIAIYAVINLKDGPESEKLSADLEKLPNIDTEIARRCVGPEGPKTLEELRILLDIPTPDLTNLNLDEEEKKYSVAGDKTADKKNEAPVEKLGKPLKKKNGKAKKTGGKNSAKGGGS
jgi:adenylate cyclase